MNEVNPMTIGDLKKIIKDIPDNIQIFIDVPMNNWPYKDWCICYDLLYGILRKSPGPNGIDIDNFYLGSDERFRETGDPS